jgi:hypothetical protein
VPSSGLLTGLVVSSEDGVEKIVSISRANKPVNITGHLITSYLSELLLRRGYAFNKASGFETTREREDNQHGTSNVDIDKRTPSRLADLKNLLRQFKGELYVPEEAFRYHTSDLDEFNSRLET